jgi:putative serine protease PepD
VQQPPYSNRPPFTPPTPPQQTPPSPAPGPRTSKRMLAAVLGVAAIGAASGAGAYALVDSSHGGSTPAAASSVAAQASPVALSGQASLVNLYKKSSPSVVDITVTTTQSDQGFGGFGNNGGTQTAKAEGTGWVYDSKGDIVTNEHVIDGATSITVKFSNGKTTKGTLVGSDKNNDLAVIKVDPSAAKLTPLTLGNSSSVQTGQSVFTIGSGFGLSNSLTAGIVSAVNRTMTSPGETTIAGAIQTDAAINHGNSGGPLFDASGKVIGVTSQIESEGGGSDGVGFAIPVNTVKKVAASLISGEKAAATPFMGVRIGDATGGGAEISSVQTNSPASAAGLKSGDVVTAVDQTPITSAADLQSAIQGDSVGQKVTLTIDRNGASQQVQLTLGSTTS